MKEKDYKGPDDKVKEPYNLIPGCGFAFDHSRRKKSANAPDVMIMLKTPEGQTYRYGAWVATHRDGRVKLDRFGQTFYVLRWSDPGGAGGYADKPRGPMQATDQDDLVDGKIDPGGNKK